MLALGITLLVARATPSATPLLVELVVASLAVAGLLARRPVARAMREARARLAQRRASGRLTRPTRISER
jgi:hypothetical protein